jgi:kumamolisin
MLELTSSHHRLPAGSVAQRKTNPCKWIELTLGVRRKQDLPDLAALDLTAIAARRYLTRDELEATYGSAPDAVANIEAFAAQHQLVITRNEPLSARITLGGTVCDAAQAFGVTLFDYSHPTLGAFHARTGPVLVPDDVAGDITGVFGFNNHRVLQRRPELPTMRLAAATPATPRPWFLPTELATLYNFPTDPAAGQTIALLEFGGGVDPADLAAYFTNLDVPAPTVAVIPVNGASTDPASGDGATGEVMLDVEVVGAMAPGARIAVYFSTFDEKGLIDAISAVLADKANDPAVVSISWGWCENQPFGQDAPWSPSAMDHINHSFLAAAQLGITICVSTGDDGSEAQIRDGRAHVNFPASSPYVLAVGGTSLHARTDTRGATQITEVVWNDGPDSGTGGGVSDYTARPSWQDGIVPASINPGHFAGRAIPDVAANADPNTGYYVRSGGQFGIVGGTSASAPLWAALIARCNAIKSARIGNFNALLYTQLGPAHVLRDITQGNNDTQGLLDGSFAAGPGWDACTGWGVPDGQKLLAALFP